MDDSDAASGEDVPTAACSECTKIVVSQQCRFLPLSIGLVDAVVDGCLDTIKTYDYEDHIHRRIIVVLYCFHIYLCLEIMLVVAAATARWLLSAELEPQFNEPYLSTSLQDFWGRRWNLMVMRMPRPTVYPCLTGQRRWAAGGGGRRGRDSGGGDGQRWWTSGRGVRG
ncbi:PREDICTED: probable long-chain-alcohol O-fatty-acyltransferase 1 [Erythranthe guttata]|uniref:probable long-chain-alcohol O-fatty-acyltransferase 1 n=1 Tax=Erythranthe guttata TaxID=4155 RepID=UPI00064E052E|nr:PREDICTED: probable long-chain-alcohol O-fatty-acyltransferase 1 [Erythranthe guttata]|eukprot:XP_012849579.1 PREDICTED: probable long-chain-alcohol O-fatty-acyltransferase 1 [Erythranthe guttata]